MQPAPQVIVCSPPFASADLHLSQLQDASSANRAHVFCRTINFWLMQIRCFTLALGYHRGSTSSTQRLHFSPHLPVRLLVVVNKVDYTASKQRSKQQRDVCSRDHIGLKNEFSLLDILVRIIGAVSSWQHWGYSEQVWGWLCSFLLWNRGRN